MQTSTEKAEVKVEVAPTPEQVDALIISYETALADVDTLQKVANERKAEISGLVQKFGAVPTNAKASKRLQGLTRAAMLTWATSVSVNEPGVAELKAYLEKQGMPELFDKFYELMPPPVYVPPPPKHRRVGDLMQVLSGLQTKLGKRVQTSIAALYAQCSTSRTNAPAFKVECLEKKS